MISKFVLKFLRGIRKFVFMFICGVRIFVLKFLYGVRELVLKILRGISKCVSVFINVVKDSVSKFRREFATFFLLLFSAQELSLVLTAFPLPEGDMYWKWVTIITYQFKQFLFFLSLSVISGFLVVFGLKSLSKPSSDQKFSWPTPFGLSFPVISVMFLVSLLITNIALYRIPCEIPFLGIEVQGVDKMAFSGSVVDIKSDSWTKVQAKVFSGDDETPQRVFCFWENSDGLEITNRSTCTTFVHPTVDTGRAVLTLATSAPRCLNPERITHLVLSVHK